MQRTGSFKFRGAYNALAALRHVGREQGVVGASSGNHAQALALAGRLLELPVTVVVPRDAPAAKVNGARSLGARIISYDRHSDDRDAITGALAAEYSRHRSSGQSDQPPHHRYRRRAPHRRGHGRVPAGRASRHAGYGARYDR